MESFAEVLQVGGRSNSLGRTGEVVEAVLAEPSRVRELLDCAYADDAWVRMRAVDGLEKVCRHDPALVEPLVPELLDRLTASEQASVQWHLAQVLGQVRLAPGDRDRAVAWLLARVATTDVDWIAAVESMRTLVGMVAAGHLDVARVALLVEVQRSHRSASVRRKAAGFAEELAALDGR